MVLKNWFSVKDNGVILGYKDGFAIIGGEREGH